MKKCAFFLSLLMAIIELQAQDYQINFAGTGASVTVGTVKVENLTQSKSITLSGADILHLVATSTGLNLMPDVDNTLRIYPNLMTGNSTIDFAATSPGITNIELFDITGKRVVTTHNTLPIGTHSFIVSGLSSGIYTLRINSQAYSYAGKLVSNGAPGSELKISYNGYSVIPVTPKKLKSANAEKVMQYTTGDRLKITGTTGKYSTLLYCSQDMQSMVFRDGRLIYAQMNNPLLL
jgi:Secretion system C-terminal sorting domain